MPVEKSKLQQLALIRLDEAKALLERDRPSGAFHLAGLALEVAIKACIATRFDRHVIPDKKFVNAIYDHDLRNLMELASLLPDLDNAPEGLQKNWQIARGWKIESRYDLVPEADARQMLAAISDPPNGVFTWIQTHW